MSEWRDIWKEIIDISKKTLLEKDTELKCFKQIEEKYKNDKMITFEKGITCECFHDFENAKKYYELAANEKNGLPVAHWRKRAKYFLERISTKGCSLTYDLNLNYDYETIQWDTFYNIHSYFYLDDYIRYLAISSVSRIHSEPAMAIIIFRVCIETGLYTYFNESVKRIRGNKKYFSLDELLKQMFERPYSLFKSNEYTAYDKIRHEGNIAAHPGIIKENEKPYKYNDDQLKYILNDFNQSLFFLNERAKNKKQ